MHGHTLGKNLIVSLSTFDQRELKKIYSDEQVYSAVCEKGHLKKKLLHTEHLLVKIYVFFLLKFTLIKSTQ